MIVCRRISRANLLVKLAPRLEGHEFIAAIFAAIFRWHLEIFACVVSENTLHPVEKLVARLRQARNRSLAKWKPPFQVNYDLLEEPLRGCWTLLAIFPDNFDLPAVAAIWEMKTELARDIMEALLKASLVEIDDAKVRLRLHDLVRQFCDGKMSEAERDAAMMLYAKHYTKVGGEAQIRYLKGGENMRLRAWDCLTLRRVHLEAAYEWLAPRRDEASAALLILLVAGVLLTGLELRFRPDQRIRWLERQREAARITKNRLAESTALGNIGLAYTYLENPRKAIEFFEEALVIDREVGNRSGEGTALGNLGVAIAKLGQIQKAIDFFEQQLVITGEIVDRRGEGSAHTNLGLANINSCNPRKAVEI